MPQAFMNYQVVYTHFQAAFVYKQVGCVLSLGG